MRVADDSFALKFMGLTFAWDDLIILDPKQ